MAFGMGTVQHPNLLKLAPAILFQVLGALLERSTDLPGVRKQRFMGRGPRLREEK